MLKLAIFCSSILYAFGAIYNLPDLNYLNDNDVGKEAKYNVWEIEQHKDEMWVLELNEEGLDLRTMRTANKKEEEAFDRVVGPMIEAYQHRRGRRVKREDPTEAVTQINRKVRERRNKKMKQEMMRLINKFTMSVKSDPDVMLSAAEESDGPSLVLYIKDVYTCLTVQSNRKESHFFIPPPSPLPAWLYQCPADAVTSLDIPDDVRDQLYEKLLHLLQMFLSFPV